MIDRATDFLDRLVVQLHNAARLCEQAPNPLERAAGVLLRAAADLVAAALKTLKAVERTPPSPS
jgi:hypothetical protein